MLWCQERREICVAYEASRLKVAGEENSGHVFISKLIQYIHSVKFFAINILSVAIGALVVNINHAVHFQMSVYNNDPSPLNIFIYPFQMEPWTSVSSTTQKILASELNVSESE